MQYLMAIDQGTTGTTVLILDAALNVHASVNREFPQIYPKPGWVEHNPAEIWSSVVGAIAGALDEAGIRGDAVAAIGITNQRETTFVWEKSSGAHIHNAIVWQCRRTADRCEALRAQGHEELVRKKTGLVLDPYFSGTKAAWILDNANGRGREEDLLFGTVDTYLVWRLSGGEAHVTDVSNAARTMLMDIHSLEWCDELLGLLDVPRSILPEIRSNAEVYATTKGVPGLPDGIPIAGMAGDQQSALFGQACFEPGEAKCTFGTGAFLLMNTGDTPVASTNGMLTTVGWQINGQTTYALEGSTFIAGAIVQWLRVGLQFIEDAAEIEALASTVQSSEGVVLVPSLTGLGAPHWNADARGVIWGLTRGTTRAHIARAALEGIAHQNADVLTAMIADLASAADGLSTGLRILKVDGGAAANNLLMQIQADLLGSALSRPDNLQTTALGAALLAGLGAGIFSDLDAVRAAWREDRRFSPVLAADERATQRAQWGEGIKRV